MLGLIIWRRQHKLSQQSKGVYIYQHKGVDFLVPIGFPSDTNNLDTGLMDAKIATLVALGVKENPYIPSISSTTVDNNPKVLTSNNERNYRYAISNAGIL